jgi:hypothetical protein
VAAAVSSLLAAPSEALAQPSAPWPDATAPSVAPTPPFAHHGWVEARPDRLAWQEDEPIPPGYAPIPRADRGLLIGGAVTFGAPALASFLVGFVGVIMATEEADFAPFFAPVVGPFIAVETTDAEGAIAYALVLDGVLQGAGLGMLIASFVDHDWALGRTDLPRRGATLRVHAGGGSMEVPF